MPSDREILRELGKKITELAHTPINEERKRLWRKHNSLRGERPMVLAEAFGLKGNDAIPFPLRCEAKHARTMERQLLSQIYQFEHVGDDLVVEPYCNVAWQVKVSDYGVSAEVHHADNDGSLDAIKWDPPIKDIARDFHMLHPLTFSVDRKATMAEKALVEEIFDGTLGVRIRGNFFWTTGLTSTVIRMIGLDNLMLFMYDDPQGLHRLMGFLRDNHLAYAKWLEAEGLLTLNNEGDYIGSGGHGYCDDLPQKDYTPGAPARLKDLWVLSESQETVMVSPQMFEEFVFPYQKSIVEHYGLLYYGCCEPLHTRWKVVEKFPRLRSLSISPWCDQKYMAEQIGRKYVFCRKPAPSMISTSRFDEDEIRADIRNTLTVARGCEIEFAMKDVHTLAGQPERLGRWVQLAREVIGEFH